MHKNDMTEANARKKTRSVTHKPWGADEPRVSKVVLIGRNIDRDEMMASFKACMVDAPTKPTGATQPRKAKSWYEMAAEGVLF